MKAYVVKYNGDGARLSAASRQTEGKDDRGYESHICQTGSSMNSEMAPKEPTRNYPRGVTTPARQLFLHNKCDIEFVQICKYRNSTTFPLRVDGNLQVGRPGRPIGPGE